MYRSVQKRKQLVSSKSIAWNAYVFLKKNMPIYKWIGQFLGNQNTEWNGYK